PNGWAFCVWDFGFNVIAVLSSLLPSQRYSPFAFLSQLSFILFSVAGWRGRRTVVRTATDARA
ncbi:hypothetical protein, partial [Plesiomonas shigelloides]|uniref:hypothetical protein n=1 Tax=Plesiomonas shigelloides TaxID=703 RepID=UPI0021190B99